MPSNPNDLAIPPRNPSRRRSLAQHVHRTVGRSGTAQSDAVIGIDDVVADERRGGRGGVDLRAALGQARQREVGSIAGTVGDGR